MKQTDIGSELTSRKTRKGKCLDEISRVAPWGALQALIEPHAPCARTGTRAVRD